MLGQNNMKKVIIRLICRHVIFFFFFIVFSHRSLSPIQKPSSIAPSHFPHGHPEQMRPISETWLPLI